MNNLLIGFKRFLKNKNTVTIIGVLLIIGILYFTYNKQIESQVNPQGNIPVAKVTIQPGQLITSDMITTIRVAPIVLNHGNIYTSSYLVEGKYSSYNTLIPEGSMFYQEALIDEVDLPDSAFVKIKDGDEVYRFPVTTTSTYGNSIFPGNKIDLYMKVINVNGQIMVGKLLENIEVVAVKDSGGNNVFEDSEANRTPAMLIFGLSPENHNMLLKAKYLTNFSVELFPVPHGGTIEREGETKVSSTMLKDFISAYSVPNDELIQNENVEGEQQEELPEENINE